ncbi:DUF3889 domain-containing protein [Aquibacillus sediminis]|uniref:DUF3889 domain-containing protein n=1 Tax=Aquibacillus sediminis TaxID=2574734 RepID=UPI001109C334|nr:DUF3889 domain-containing protein [Aquibacillus sediminis]
MYQHYYHGNGYYQPVNYTYPYAYSPQVYGPYHNNFSAFQDRQQSVQGQATWTEGGQTTQCGIAWSTNQYMTAAVSDSSPYQCGQLLKIKNLSLPGEREIIVTVVDKVEGYPANKVNLHRQAFQALGANPSIGVLSIEITPSPELEQERWGKYLLEVTQVAYPNYNVTEYNLVSKNQLTNQRMKETYEYILQSNQEQMKVRGTVTYNPSTDRIISFDITEVND